MLNYMKEYNNKTITTNGDAAYRSTMNNLLDLFYKGGTMRKVKASNIEKLFDRAFIEDPALAVKCAFYLRDARQGAGERRVFRIILKHLLKTKKRESFKELLEAVPEYGRWDDILEAFNTPYQNEAVQIIKKKMQKDMKSLRENKLKEISLMAKWLPSENASSKVRKAIARKLARALKMENEKYRKNLSQLRAAIRIVETKLTKREYDFSYEQVPSLAMLKYNKAFQRNDSERFSEYIKSVKENKAKINTKVLMPYQISQKLRAKNCSNEEIKTLETLWENLPDYAGASDALVMVDGSGSMYQSERHPLPIDVALSLGIYFAEHNKGRFKNHIITFSSRPQLVELRGNGIKEKLDYLATFDDCTNTNMEKAFKLILETAVAYRIPQSEMPKKLYIFSDMQFDRNTKNSDLTVFQAMKRLYEENGYTLPQVIFWNVAEGYETVPVTVNESGVILVSGFNANLFKMIEEDNFKYNPMDFMLKVLTSERYAKISV